MSERNLASKTPPAVVLAFGLFFGLLFGWGGHVILTDTDNTESFVDYKQRQNKGRGNRGPGGSGRPRNPGNQGNPGGDPHGGGRPRNPGESIIKVHFMKKFLAALTTTPKNNWANPAWKPLLKADQTLQCADCHDSGDINMEAMKGMDPGPEKAEPYRDNPRFMIGLMKNWVKRLNNKHRDKLVRNVTCTDCHRYDPYEAYGGLPPLMANFVAALSKPPKNSDPNPDWKPLLKKPDQKTRFCAECHGDTGAAMEIGIEAALSESPDKSLDKSPKFPMVGRFRGDKQLMIDVMERWVKQLNRTLGKKLRKAVVCIDCHATDPRR